MASLHTTALRRWILSLPPVEFLTRQLRDLLIGSLKRGPVPQHIAFVMDGNRRYAKKNGVETVEGHHRGFEALARILEVCYKSGVKVVTIYAFSIENFKRSRYEVDALMDMAKTKLVQMSQHGELLNRYGARVRILGDRSLMREDVLAQMDRAQEMTKNNGEAVLNVCFPYTGREEITHSVRETVREFSTPEPQRPPQKRGFSETHIRRNILSRQHGSPEQEHRQSRPGTPRLHLPTASPEDDLSTTSTLSSLSSSVSSSSDHDANDPTTSPHTSFTTSPILKPTTSPSPRRLYPDPETISAATLTAHTYTGADAHGAAAPPLDLLIRTSGVFRLSDFMLWQCHERTELRFLDCLWPEFDLWRFLPVLVEWQWRERERLREGEAERARART